MTTENQKPNGSEEPAGMPAAIPAPDAAQAASEAAEEAAMEAAYGAAAAITSNAEVVDPLGPLPGDAEPEKKEEGATASPPAVQPQKQAPATPEFFLGEMTKDEVIAKLGKIDELNEALARVNDLPDALTKLEGKAFGKIGTVVDQLKHLQERESRPTVGFSPEALGKVRELDEKLADALGASLQEGLKVQEFDPATLDPLVQKQVKEGTATLAAAFQETLLDVMHPGWDSLPDDPQYREWYFAQPKDVQKQLAGPLDVVYSSQKIKEYEGWVEAKEAKAKAAAKAAKLEEENLRRAAEETAAAPGASTIMTEDEAMAAAYEAAKSR